MENVSENIVGLELGHGFKFTVYEYEKLAEILLAISGDGYQHSCEYDHLYSYFESKGRKDNYVVITGDKSDKIDEDLDYLRTVIDIMRLYKPGNIRLIWYCFHDEIKEDDLGGQVASVGSSFGSEIFHTVDDAFYDISALEIRGLKKIIEGIRLPFSHDYVNLAYKTYQKTYEINDINLSFLVSVIGIEVLLNPSHIEITHRVSRNLAVLLGEDREKGIEIYNHMKKLYGLRSRIVHGRLLRVDSRNELSNVRAYLSKSIKKISEINQTKDDLLLMLNLYGYGELYTTG